ncbi:hypothetical protein BX616_010033 [Lobosporangium transversale]|uniref:Uncharacterized protein n=1 Tax=Lobosporangium transversale TaxID=64571 RepID=A0A1Y2G9I8_9FUNG|nr:hypothetical protein BCR41DRAFT_362320 [Lobosporangium transversale]KAF9913437.1 hypothetical protein BX616_010033 [Lobosporangium transversale]ORZ04842.1 hypothetical protein BCR41DRAFT_362320 [Lobosporangium transversale]|eukprot:XP_021876779.1 hypothetical protein BCR41DRAFT_362320 [Lobosporangium transversale]
MNATRERSRSDPHESTLDKLDDCPPALSKRHHHRSVDRIWPPALEVKLARLSMDEGPCIGPHIIPPPPPVPFHTPSSELERDAYTDSRLEPIQEGQAISTTISPLHTSSGLGAPAMSSGSTTFLSDKRRNSILGPLSPSSTFQMDRHLFHQYTHPPHIDVQYRKRCKSMSPRGDKRFNIILYNDHGEKSMVGSQHIPMFSPPLRNIRTSVTTPEEPTKYGEDLFHRSTSEFQEHLEYLVKTRAPPQLTMPRPQSYQHAEESCEKGHCGREVKEHRMDQVRQKHDRVKDVDGENGLNQSPLEHIPSCNRSSQPPVSPMRKNPLSAASTPSSRTNSRQSSPTRLCSRQSLQRSNHDVQLDHSLAIQQQLQPEVHTTETDGWKMSPTFMDNPERRRYSLVADDQEGHNDFIQGAYERMSKPSSPNILDISIPNDQDHWRSPTLSTLGSQPTSRARSPSSPRLRPTAPSGLSTGTTIAMAMSTRRSRPPGVGLARSRHQALFRETEDELAMVAVEQAEEETEIDMRVEIPLIEAHDEISLQDIWQMEDEERNDRMKGEGNDSSTGQKCDTIHVSLMKGEEHAHEEARLIQDILDGNYPPPPHHHHDHRQQHL